MRVVTAGVHSLTEGQKVKVPEGGASRERFQSLRLGAQHRSLVWYFMIVFVVAGVFSYINLGREEDPTSPSRR
jgi:hypothetical protein